MNSNDHGMITWNFLPHDSVFDAGRSRIKVSNAMELPDDFRFTVNAENVSDTHYFEDFAQGPEGTSTAFLQQQAKVTYRDEHLKIDGEVQHYACTTDYIARRGRTDPTRGRRDWALAAISGGVQRSRCVTWV